MGICASQQEKEAAEHAAWLDDGKEISIDCRFAGAFEGKIELSLNQRLSVSTVKEVIVVGFLQHRGYAHKEFVFASDVVLEMGNTALNDTQTLEDEGVEENAMLTMIVNMEVTNESTSYSTVLGSCWIRAAL